MKEPGCGQILQTSDPVSDRSHLCSTKVTPAVGAEGFRGSMAGQGVALATQGRGGGIQDMLYLEDGLLSHGGLGERGSWEEVSPARGLGTWVDGDASGEDEMGEGWYGFGHQ